MINRILKETEKDSAMYILIPIAVVDVLLLGVAISRYLGR